MNDRIFFIDIYIIQYVLWNFIKIVRRGATIYGYMYNHDGRISLVSVKFQNVLYNAWKFSRNFSSHCMISC